MRVTKNRHPRSNRKRNNRKSGSRASTTPYLDGLVQFLNVKDFDSVKVPRELALLLRHISIGLTETASPDNWIANKDREIGRALKLISPFQQELIDKLLPFTSLPPFKNSEWSWWHQRLASLVSDLNGWKFQTVFRYENVDRMERRNLKEEKDAPGISALMRRLRYADLSAKTRVFLWAGDRWIVHQNFIAPLDAENRPLGFLYSIIAEALVTGYLVLLRRCPYCENFLLAVRDKRTRFCPGHMRLYYDDPRRAKIRVELSRAKNDS